MKCKILREKSVSEVLGGRDDVVVVFDIILFSHVKM